MKQLIRLILTSLSLIVMCAAGAAYAQSPTVIRVNIPFEFTLGDRTFPAGNYSLVQPLQHFLVLRDARGQSIASTFTSGLESSAVSPTSKLRFESIAGQNVLSEVWQQDVSSGQKLYPTRTKTSSYLAKRRSPEARQTAEGSQP